MLRWRAKRSVWSQGHHDDTIPVMTIEPRLDIIGAALADPSRARILCALMDGRALTNKELSCAAGITPQTASAHLKHLQSAGLTTSLRSGRHIYHQIVSAEVASVLENLASLSSTDHLVRDRRAGADRQMARCCYNHIAGRLGVLMTDRLVAEKVLNIRDGIVRAGPRYHAFLRGVGLRIPRASDGKPRAKLCLDWTERRHHISGPLATAILQEALEKGWLERKTGSRNLTITDPGFAALARWFGLSQEMLDAADDPKRFDR